jgi:ferric-dicitrate binding protein FerR (iron transport regulator)
MEGLITKQLLLDFFDEKATSLQRKLVEEWLEAPENEELFYSYLDEWERKNPQFFPDRENAQQKYSALLRGEVEPQQPPETEDEDTGLARTYFPYKMLWLVSASVALVMAFFFRSELIYKEYTAPPGQTNAFYLEDGSHVVLNANSVLRVPRFFFEKGRREVWLDGEAEFQVKHTENNARFSVLMGNEYEIEVLGTEFTAYSRARGKRVFLKMGKVKLNLPAGEQIYMKPGSYFSADSLGTYEVSTPQQPEAITAWKEQAFFFDNTQLSEIAEQIYERFQIKIVIKEKALANRKIGGTFQARNADELLETLSELLEMKITQKTDYIELSTLK